MSEILFWIISIFIIVLFGLAILFIIVLFGLAILFQIEEWWKGGKG